MTNSLQLRWRGRLRHQRSTPKGTIRKWLFGLNLRTKTAFLLLGYLLVLLTMLLLVGSCYSLNSQANGVAFILLQ